MQGIYIIKNKITNNCYVGVSADIKSRWATHKSSAFNDSPNNKEYNKPLYKAFRKHGIENFEFLVLEELPESDTDELYSREQFWITEFDCYHNGYNQTPGGDIGLWDRHGEKHPNHILGSLQVREIRQKWAKCKLSNKEIYIDYKDKISWSGFSKIVAWNTWKHQDLDLFSKEAKEWHFRTSQSRPGENNPKAKLKKEDVVEIRKRKLCGEGILDVFNDYKYTKILLNGFRKVWEYKTWKTISEDDIKSLIQE